MDRYSQHGADETRGSEGTLDAADARGGSFLTASMPPFPLGRLGLEPAELASFRADMFPKSGSGEPHLVCLVSRVFSRPLHGDSDK